MPLPPPRRTLPERPSEPDEGASQNILPEPRQRPPELPHPPPRRTGVANMILQVVGMIIVMAAALIFMLWEGDKLPNDPGEIERIRQAARMNPFPKDATAIQLLQPDQALDKNYGVMFSAPNFAVETWLAISPGTQNTKGEYVAGNIIRYVIALKPNDPKAAKAEVRWKRDEQRVWISIPPGALGGG